MKGNRVELVKREDRGGLCTLTLNRPEKLNALNSELFIELDAHLAALETEIERIGCVVLRGAGKAFCAVLIWLRHRPELPANREWTSRV
jgi:enoyl-CoA hydratase/carnithine racemase